MKILLVTSDLSGRSGWSRYAKELGMELRRQGHDIAACVTSEEESIDIPQYLLPFPPTHLTRIPLSIWTAWKLRPILQDLRPDIVHFIAEPYALVLPFFPRREWRAVITLHGSYAVSLLAAKGLLGRLTRHTYQCADQIISVSHFTKGTLQKTNAAFFEHANLSEKVTVIPNAVRIPSKPTKQWQKESEEKYIIGIGAVKERKGYREALEALAKFADSAAIPFRYDIYGDLTQDPLYKEALLDLAEKLGLRSQIFLHGSVSDEELEEAFARSDLFLLLSKTKGYDIEGFGIVFLEANAHGVPVIGPRSGGCPEAIADGKSGYICDPGNPEEVAARIHDVLMKGSINREDCIAWAKEHSIEKITKDIVRVYEEELPSP